MTSLLPPQHGAWAFVGLPLALGAIVAPGTALLPVLAIAWIAAYPLSYAALALVRARHGRRFRGPFVLWSAVALPPAFIVVAWRPWLIWVGLCYLALFAVNLRYVRCNDERAIGNDLVFIAECTAMVVVTWAVGAGRRSWWPPDPHSAPRQLWILATICALVLVGSTLHVKSLIRQRRDARYARWSKVLAVASIPAALALAAWWGRIGAVLLVIPFVAMGLRAFLTGRRPLRPALIGLIELGGFVMIAAAAFLASR